LDGVLVAGHGARAVAVVEQLGGDGESVGAPFAFTEELAAGCFNRARR
jgi:hypothetical protein